MLGNLTGQLNIPCRSSSNNNLEEQFLQLENKLAVLASLELGTPGQPKSSTLSRERRNENSELQIESLLEKTEKYQESEKIFTQDTFRQEYSREISRSRKQKVRH